LNIPDKESVEWMRVTVWTFAARLDGLGEPAAEVIVQAC